MIVRVTKIECDPIMVRYKRPTGVYKYQKFFNRDEAAKRLAWWIIGDRYNGMSEYPKRFECDCGDVDNGIVVLYHSNAECLVHNRDDGYFRRLHVRVYWWIKQGYMLEESGLKQ